MKMVIFSDRKEAGRLLASELKQYRDRPSTMVLGIARGGVPVAFEVAERLHLPLDVYVVRKLGVPGHEELAMGAVAQGGVYVLHHDVIDGLKIQESTIRAVLHEEQKELERRERLYRKGRPLLSVAGQTILLIDDGLATGSSMRAAIRMLRRRHAEHLTVGVPVAPVETCERLKAEGVEVVCVRVVDTEPFFAIGSWYKDFSPTTDEEVCDLLKRARAPRDRPIHS